MSFVIDSKRKKGERFETFLRRFNKRVIQSGKIMEARSKRYHESADNKNKTKRNKLIRMSFREKMDYLRKTGQIKEDPRRRRRRR